MKVWIIYTFNPIEDDRIREIRHDSKENAELRAEFFYNESQRDCTGHTHCVVEYDSVG